MSARAALLATLAVLAAGVVLWVAAPWKAADPEAGLAGTTDPTSAEGRASMRADAGGGPAPEAMEATADAGRADADTGARSSDAPSAVPALYGQTLLEAQAWLAKRRIAKQADDKAAEEAAREEWERIRKQLLESIRRDLPGAKRLLAWLGGQDDEETALYVGRIFPFVWVDGFEQHLLATLESDAPTLARRLALVGLRGRGLQAAGAVTRVAAKAQDAALRAHATEEIASHVRDPHAAPKRLDMHRAATANLGDKEPSVRRAALVALISDRNPLTDDQKAAVRARLDDPDRGVRDLASALLKRQ